MSGEIDIPWQVLPVALPVAGPASYRVGCQPKYARTVVGTPKIYTTTGFGLRKIGKWLVWTIWWCICKLLVEYSHFPNFSRPKPGGGINVTIWVQNRRFELKPGPDRGVLVQIT